MLNSITVLLGWFWHQITHEGWYAIKENKSKQEQNEVIFWLQLFYVLIIFIEPVLVSSYVEAEGILRGF